MEVQTTYHCSIWHISFIPLYLLSRYVLRTSIDKIYIYIYMCVCVCVYVYIYIYTYIYTYVSINRLSDIWKSDLTDKIKRSFFQAAVVSILLYVLYTQHYNNDERHNLLEKYTSHFIWKGCVWEGVEDRTELQHIDPNSIGHQRFFPVLLGCSSGDLGAQPL